MNVYIVFVVKCILHTFLNMLNFTRLPCQPNEKSWFFVNGFFVRRSAKVFYEMHLMTGDSEYPQSVIVWCSGCETDFPNLLHAPIISFFRTANRAPVNWYGLCILFTFTLLLWKKKFRVLHCNNDAFLGDDECRWSISETLVSIAIFGVFQTMTFISVLSYLLNRSFLYSLSLFFPPSLVFLHSFSISYSFSFTNIKKNVERKLILIQWF